MSAIAAGALQRGLAIAAAALVLAACAVPVKPTPAAKPAPAPPPNAAPLVPSPQIPHAAPATTTAGSPWPRLRQRLAMHGCEYRKEVVGWAQRYTASPRSFERSMQRALPFLLIVVDELERRNLPGEFAMLPFVESRYEPVDVRGNRPAGMWQLMPQTARGNGLEVSDSYDERLDPVAATRVSLGLVERYAERFDDWRLANMAFNAGEFRVEKLLAGREASSFSAAELARLTFSSTTHEHLDKLLALACIIDEPDRFDVDLPEPGAADRLLEIELGAPLDLRVAARLADIDRDTLLRYNAAWRGVRMGGPPPYRLLLPTDNARQLQASLERIPEQHWLDWREVHTRQATDWNVLASAGALSPELLARINGADGTRPVVGGATVLLPGRETVARVAPEPDRRSPARVRSHVVQRGDTLGAIARKYGVKLAQLLNWNGRKAKSVLRPGERLRVAPASNVNEAALPPG